MKKPYNPDSAQDATNSMVEGKFLADSLSILGKDHYNQQPEIQKILKNVVISDNMTQKEISKIFVQQANEYIANIVKNTLQMENEQLYRDYISLPISADVLNKEYGKVFAGNNRKQSNRPKLSKGFLIKITKEVEKKSLQDGLDQKYGEIMADFSKYIQAGLHESLYTKVLDFITMIQKKGTIHIDVDDEDRFHRLAKILVDEKNAENERTFSLRFIDEIRELTAFLQSKLYKTFTSSKTEAIKELLDVIRGRGVVISPEDEKRFYAIAKKIIKEKKL